jgi:hypothetical protein
MGAKSKDDGLRKFHPKSGNYLPAKVQVTPIWPVVLVILAVALMIALSFLLAVG